MKDNTNTTITTVNDLSPRIGPGTSIYDKPEIKNVKVRCVPVGNLAYDTLVEGNTYLVYRKHIQTGEPTYSLCIYRDGYWIPYGLDDIIKSMTQFTGIPVLEDDHWVCANIAFNEEKPTDEPEQESEKHNPDEDSNEETVQEYVKRRNNEIADEEEEEQRKAKEEKMGRKMAGEFVPRGMPITQSPESYAIRNLNRTIEILMEYIQKLKDGIIDEPVMEQNWEHLKTFTNDLCDRISELEQKVAVLQLMPYNPYNPCTPYIPASPNTPLVPNQPSIPHWPYEPIITYSLPGGISMTSTLDCRRTGQN
jgi:hypothetical protein